MRSQTSKWFVVSVFAVFAAVLLDVGSTYCVLLSIPIAQEASPIVRRLIHLLGLEIALVLWSSCAMTFYATLLYLLDKLRSYFTEGAFAAVSTLGHLLAGTANSFAYFNNLWLYYILLRLLFDHWPHHFMLLMLPALVLDIYKSLSEEEKTKIRMKIKEIRR